MRRTKSRGWGPVAVAMLVVAMAACWPAVWGRSPIDDPAASATGSRWSQLADMTTPHEYHAAVAVDGKIYVLGGEPVAQFEEYDPASNRWRVLPQMPTPGRSFLGAAALGDKIYAMGGISRQVNACATVEAYDRIKGAWSTCADLRVPRNRLAAAATNGKIYALGGMDAGGNSSAVEQYDPAQDRWLRKKDMPIACHGHSAVTMGDKIFVLGGEGEGFGKLATVYEYNPAKDLWTKRADMPTPRAFLGAAVAGGYLYAIGGRVVGAAPVERYEPGKDQWSRLEPMPGPLRNRFGIATVAGKIYILGGEQQSDRRVPRSVWRYDPDMR
jgi:N-acetylneuraminic acid mutarotase